MRAVVAQHPGPPDVLVAEERPDLGPAPGGVVVEVAVAATTFIDTQMRAGGGPRPLPPEAYPVVLGNGVAGTVCALGPGVDGVWQGARVVTSTGGQGGYASQARAQLADLHRIPDGVSDEKAAAVLADGRTALSLTGAAAVQPGEVVAVTAAAGGVGSLLVQLGAQAGALIVALASSPEKRARARSLGAEVALDYTSTSWVDELDAVAPKLDVVFDGVGGATSASLAARIASGGRYLPHGAASGSFGDLDPDALADRGGRVIPLLSLPGDPATLHALVEEALALAAAGVLHPSIGLVLPLERAAEAHAAMEARTVLGKTLLLP
jgi:NADPH2:quinone reductase